MEKIIVGNLKMNLEEEKIEEYIKILNNTKFSNVQLYIAPSFLYLNKFKNDNYKLTAQNISSHNDGDYTGEVSATQLKSIGVSSVIIGHSERRKIFNETDEIINEKVKKALLNKLEVILCIGNETKTEISNVIEELTKTLENDLNGVDDFSNIIIAYEPIYAINNGDSENPEKIKNIIYKLKQYFKTIKKSDIRIIYGGSVSDKNIQEIVDVCDGVIVGKNSLNIEKFVNMIKKVK